ncbi:Uncharacterised protein g1998 [Pycnogonum litorale]
MQREFHKRFQLLKFGRYVIIGSNNENNRDRCRYFGIPFYRRTRSK